MRVEDIFGILPTTVVGSFPLNPFVDVSRDYPPYFDGYPDDEPPISNPYLPSMQRALKLQFECGIDLPAYGQLQSMISMFLGPLEDPEIGLRRTGELEWELVGELGELGRCFWDEYIWWMLRYRELFRGVKIPLTGPITLAFAVRIGDGRLLDYEDLLVEFSRKVVARYARCYDRFGAGIISLDEPSLSFALQAGLRREMVIEALEVVLREIRKSVSQIHVCGKLDRDVVDLLLETSAEILDHEFATNPENIEIYQRSDLERADKMLGFGCVISNVDARLLSEISQGKRSWRDAVEDERKIENLARKACEKFGYERILLKPDCGFGGMRMYFSDFFGEEEAMGICREKLLRLTRVAGRLRRELGISTN